MTLDLLTQSFFALGSFFLTGLQSRLTILQKCMLHRQKQRRLHSQEPDSDSIDADSKSSAQDQACCIDTGAAEVLNADSTKLTRYLMLVSGGLENVAMKLFEQECRINQEELQVSVPFVASIHCGASAVGQVLIESKSHLTNERLLHHPCSSTTLSLLCHGDNYPAGDLTCLTSLLSASHEDCWDKAFALYRLHCPSKCIATFRVNTICGGCRVSRLQLAAQLGSWVNVRSGWRVNLTCPDIEVLAMVAGKTFFCGIVIPPPSSAVESLQVEPTVQSTGRLTMDPRFWFPANITRPRMRPSRAYLLLMVLKV
jgi:hypothetical protein